ncbi:hypothetical protein JCM30760_16500 [Thiomicrorhabdus hydrogeniphila]
MKFTYKVNEHFLSAETTCLEIINDYLLIIRLSKVGQFKAKKREVYLQGK